MSNLADRVAELSTGTGTGTLSLVGAVPGRRSFTTAFGAGSTVVYYGIVQDGTGQWEVGIGTYLGASHALQRDTVLSSSAGASKVNFPAGDKIAYVTQPAEATMTLRARRPSDAALSIHPASGQTADLVQVFDQAGSMVLSLTPGIVNINHGTPQVRLAETDMADPAGRFRIVSIGGTFAIQRATAAAWSTAASILSVSPTGALTLSGSTITLDGAITGMNLTNPLISPPSLADGQNAMTIGIQTAWFLGQAGSGAATDLELRPQLTSSKLRLRGPGRLIGMDFDANAQSIASTGSFLTLASLTVAPQLQVRTDGNKAIYFTNAAGTTTQGVLYAQASDGSLIMKTGNDAAILRLFSDGIWNMDAGFWDGINFGSVAVTARDFLARHIDLYGGAYGFSVSAGALNIVTPAAGVAQFFSDGSILAQVAPAGATTVNGLTIMTREKADARYAPIGGTGGVLTASRVDTTTGLQVLNTAGTDEFGFLTKDTTAILLRRRTAGTTYAQLSLDQSGDIHPSIGRFSGDGTGLDLGTNPVLAAIAGLTIEYGGTPGIFRRTNKGEAFAKNTNYSGSQLRWAGLAVSDAPYDAALEGAANTAPPGTWKSFAQISAVASRYCIGMAVRVV